MQEGAARVVARGERLTNCPTLGCNAYLKKNGLPEMAPRVGQLVATLIYSAWPACQMRTQVDCELPVAQVQLIAPLYPLPLQSCMLAIPSEEVPMRFYTLPSCWERMLPLAFDNVRWLGFILLLQRRALGGEWTQSVVGCTCKCQCTFSKGPDHDTAGRTP